MTLTAWIDGVFRPLDEAYVHVEDRGFQFADGVYEVIACFGGRFLELDAHLARLEASCRAVRISLPYAREDLARVAFELYRRNPFADAMIYIQVTRGRAPRKHTSQPPRPTVVMTARALPKPDPKLVEEGVAGITLPDIRWRRCEIKSVMLLPSVLAKLEAERRGAYEAFWLDERGHLLEGGSTNAFAVIDGIVCTHPLDGRVLGGITRAWIIRLLRQAGVPVVERPWSPREPGVSEMFLTSTTTLALPVVRLDGEPVGGGRPGPMFRRVRAMLEAEVANIRGA
ncbi:MAG: hypothetical protein D6771_01460 [Zetaproteobacteria bacterium]|nr:MAG: hypothetical protein D6771_01460 [Zetaproteobacteria bacterium]